MTTGSASNSNANNDSSPNKKKGWPRGRKRRLISKDNNAPKEPLSGYLIFMNEQRDSLKQSQSKTGFLEANKIIAQKWAQLEPAEKQKYLEAAAADKVRYQQEVEKYRKTDVYKKFIQEQENEKQNVKRKKKDSLISNGKSSNASHQEIPTNNSVLEIPIFTEEFLNHNKLREGDLRQLRKSNTEYEEQNIILQKHIESMRTAVEKLEDETRNQQTKNSSLKQHLVSLRKTLTQAFTVVSIPGTSETPTEESVDGYLNRLHSALAASSQQHQKLIQNVKQIVNNLPNN